ncbi:MAG: Rieske 2Fe-2S domain-containing protein [Zavarzinella sp.]
MSTRHLVCTVADLPLNECKTIVVGQQPISVFHTPDGFFAIDDRCPHAGASLAGGYVENGIVTCPWHYWRIRLADGAWADNPRICIQSFGVQVDEQQIYVVLPTLPTDSGLPVIT